MSLFDDMRRIMREAAAAAEPWRAWGLQHPVERQLSEYVPTSTIYLLSPTLAEHYTVIANPRTWPILLEQLQLPDGEAAVFIAWMFLVKKTPQAPEPFSGLRIQGMS